MINIEGRTFRNLDEVRARKDEVLRDTKVSLRTRLLITKPLRDILPEYNK